MPANTPIFGFTYPCPGDVVNASSFATLANQIDTRLLSIQTDENFAVGRYRFSSFVLTAIVGVAPTVETPIILAGTNYVVPADGLYVVRVSWQAAATTITSMRMRVRVNAVAQFGKTFNNDLQVPNSSILPTNMTGLVPAVAGDSINTSVIFFGTGTMTVDSYEIDVRQVVRTL